MYHVRSVENSLHENVSCIIGFEKGLSYIDIVIECLKLRFEMFWKIPHEILS